MKIPKKYKETKERRKERVSSGVKFRPTVFRDKSKYSRKDKHPKRRDEE